MSKRVVIIGAGVIGTACAHFLQRRGWLVTLVDQGCVGGACSHANCGLISPSHVLPLAMPGAIRQSLRLMFQRNSPFYIRPRVDVRLWSWLLRFAARCTHDAMLQAGRGCHALLSSSRRMYDELMDEHGWEVEYQRRGCLFVYRSPSKLKAFAEENETVHKEFGISAERWDEQRLSQEEPALLPGMAGAWYYEMDAHLRPDILMSQWRTSLQADGVTVLEQQQFGDFLKRDRRASAARFVNESATDALELEADAFVVATGALTPKIESQLGCKIPIQPGKGYSISMPRPDPCPRYPMLFPEHRLAVTPLDSLYRLGSTMEFSGYDSQLNRKRLDGLRQSAAVYLRTPTAEPVLEEWYGWRPMTFDGLPIVDRAPRYENVWIAAGHNMLGLSMAPATGRLVAELLTGDAPHIDPAPYQFERFS